jgi:hypothetical protein
MPSMLRMLGNRGLWAGLAGLALTVPAAAQPADDPIAASNRTTDPWVAPRQLPEPADTPWLPTAEPRGKTLPSRVIGPPSEEAPPALVSWTAPVRRPITPAVPIPDRPMMPCEPVPADHLRTDVQRPPTPPEPPLRPMEPLPPPRPMTPEDLPEPPPPPILTTVAMPAEEPRPRKITTVRFLDDPPPKPAGDDAVILAMIRRGGAPTGTAADIRAAVEKACRNKVVGCQTEVAGERQVRVLLTVHSTAEWQKLYEGLQELPELGEYGLIFQVKVGK